MNGKVIQFQTSEERLWDQYVEAAERAQATLTMEDGRAAGKAWRAYINSFLAGEQLRSIYGCSE